MDIYYGAAFHEFTKAKRAVVTKSLLDRAVKKGLITPCGADYFSALADSY